MLPKLCPVFAGLVVCVAGVLSSVAAAAEDVHKYRVTGQNPGGDGGYVGEVTLSKLSKSTSAIRWVTGPDQEVTEGIAIRADKALGAAYGGDALYAMALYELKGRSIHATWATAAKPDEPGTYELNGTDYKGACAFADGSPGSVTFHPGKGNLYKVIWDLPVGRFEGVGVRLGDVLVAASGAPKGLFGVAAYTSKGDEMTGVWGTTQMTSAGKETWMPTNPGRATPASPGDGRNIAFGGQPYRLVENKSMPGAAVSEIREYLQAGEDSAGYRKKVTLQLQGGKGTDAASVAHATLDRVQKEHPGSYVEEVKVEPEAATVYFILVANENVEFNLHHYRKTATGIVSIRFVLRNKPPFETQRKFKAEQDRNYKDWIADITRLGGEAEALISASAGAPVFTPAAANDKLNPSDAELARKIKADLDRCGDIAEKFVGMIEDGKLPEAVALMSDHMFAGSSREEFVKKLEKSGQVFGKLKKFSADKKATDFAVKEGVMTFTLQGDAEYEFALVRETFSFARNDAGSIEFVGYNRTVKE